MENLQAQYDQIVGYLNEYQKFVRSFMPRLFRMMFTSPGAYNQLNKKAWKTIWRFDPLSEKTQDTTRNAVLALATDAEKRSVFFSVATSEYPTDTLSDCLRQEFLAFNFEKLAKIHDSKQSQLSRFSMKQILGVILAAWTVILKSTPKSVVEWAGMSYDEFEFYVFCVTAALAAYILVALLPSWIKYNRARKKNQRVGEILEYTVIKNA
jgi:hypothetical protein